MAKQTKMEAAALIVAANFDKSYDEVSTILKAELGVPYEKGQGYYRHVVIHELAKDPEGRVLPRVWLKRKPKDASPATTEATTGPTSEATEEAPPTPVDPEVRSSAIERIQAAQAKRNARKAQAAA